MVTPILTHTSRRFKSVPRYFLGKTFCGHRLNGYEVIPLFGEKMSLQVMQQDFRGWSPNRPTPYLLPRFVISVSKKLISSGLWAENSEAYYNKTPKVVSVGCVGLWKHNGVLSRLMEQNKTKHLLALSRIEPRVTKFDKVRMF